MRQRPLSSNRCETIGFGHEGTSGFPFDYRIAVPLRTDLEAERKTVIKLRRLGVFEGEQLKAPKLQF